MYVIRRKKILLSDNDQDDGREGVEKMSRTVLYCID